MEQADGTVDIRHLRLISRQRQKLVGMLASENIRIHKLLSDAGIRLGVVVSDLHGLSARLMVKVLIAGKSVPDVLSLTSNRLRASREEIFESLQAEELTAAHRFTLTQSMDHIEYLETEIACFDAELLAPSASTTVLRLATRLAPSAVVPVTP